jgi:DNA-binding beta-propeller fold protein YncE
MGTISERTTVLRRLATLFGAAFGSISVLALLPAAAAGSAGFGPLSGPSGCLVAPGLKGTGGCGVGKALIGPAAVAASPDGANVYVVSGTVGSTVAASFGSIAIFKRDSTTGAISEVGCWSSDGTDGRDGASGACTPTPSLLGADGVTVSPNGLAVFVASSYSASVVAFGRNPVDGSLTRLGCFQSRPPGGSVCPYGNVFVSSGALVASANNRSLYIAAPATGSVSTLTKGVTEPATPASSTPSVPEPTVASIFGVPTTQVLANPCIAVNGFDGACAVGIATQGLDSLALSPDGKNLYGAAPESNAVDVFTPDAAGTLTQSSCLKVDPPPGLCRATKLMTSPTRLTISPDGRNVYAADAGSGGAKVDVFSRDASSGALTESGCVDLQPPEKHPENNEEEEEQEAHEPTPPDPCTSVPGLASVEVLAVSGDGSSVYAIGNGSAVIFSRDPASGKLTERSCANNDDSRCTSMPQLDGIDGAALSSDGREVYVTARGSGEVMVFGVGAAVTTSQASATSAGLARVSVACPRDLSTSCAGNVMLLRSVTKESPHGTKRGAHRTTKGAHVRMKKSVHGRTKKRAHARHGDRVTRIGAGDSAGFAIRPGAHATISVRLSPSSLRLLVAHRSLRLMAVVLARPRAGGSGYGRPIVLSLSR